MEKQITVKDIVKICEGKLIYGKEELICSNICKDSRIVVEGDTYIGIKGENFNGSTFYQQALEKGAKICILQDVEIDKKVIEKYTDVAIIMVENVVKALQQLAKYKRSLYNIPVVAITGSVGKTSTKDIVASVLSEKYKVLKTEGNFNNHIGLPLTILKLKDHTAMVVEMGMSNSGEISVLTEIAKPTVAIITNVGTSHIGNLGTRENILKAKLEILEGLQDNGTLIINNDNDLLNDWYNNKNNVNTLTFGINNKSDLMATNIIFEGEKSKFEVRLEENKYEIEVPVGGNHFIYNSLCGISVGMIFNIPILQIKDAIKRFELTKSRMEIIKLPNDVTLINDCYNANYDSMKAGIEYLDGLSGNRKIAVLGDMLELGDFSKELHEKVGEEVVKKQIDYLIVVGNESKNIAKKVKNSAKENIQIFECETNEQAVQIIKSIMNNGDYILVKASNGMNFKEIVEKLKI